MNFVYPYFPVQFKKDGTVFQQSDVDTLMTGVTGTAGAPTDLFILCHGWNNNIDDATTLYQGLTSLIKDQVDANSVLSPRSHAIMGVLWPSKKFEDKDLIPSGAAALNDAVTTDQLKQRTKDLLSLLDGSEWPMHSGMPPTESAELLALLDDIEDDPAAQSRAVELVRSLLPESAQSSEDASERFFNLSPDILINKLSKSLTPPQMPVGQSASSIDPFSAEPVSGLGGAAGFRDVLGGIKSGFLHLLNYATYYAMKARAGDVGVKGVAPLIEQLRTSRPDLRIFMIGHSFGCRVVVATVNALPDNPAVFPDIVMLLQAAFSHNGLALSGDTDRGAFRDVIEKRKVRGPILITHTRNDKAVGVAYPTASRINGVTAAAFGDENDVFGGLGSNGTQTGDTTPERDMGTLLPVGSAYPFSTSTQSSKPFNLKADQFITGHSDIVKPEVAYALTSAMAAPMARGHSS